MNQTITNKESIALWDIRKLIHEKSPKVAKFIPDFLYKYASRKLHEDEINEGLIKFQHLYNFEWINAVLDHYNLPIQTKGEERIPQNGFNTFIANHPSGSNDGIAYFSIIGRYFNSVKSVSNAFLDYFPNIRDLYVPINMLSNRSRGSLHAIDSAYSSDSQVLHFPSGVVSRRYKGVIKDPEWKKSYVSKSIQHKRTIVPAYIEARNSEFFYNLSSFRRSIGIKKPFELFFLIDEMFKNHGKPIKFIFGSPIPHEMLTKDKRTTEWALLIREYIYSLKEFPNRSFEDFLMNKK